MKWSTTMSGDGDQGGQCYSHFRNFRWLRPEGTYIQANTKYVDDIIESLVLEDAKAAPTPIATMRLPSDKEHVIEDREMIKIYRHCVSVARFMRNYFPVTNYAVKELSHGLSSPTKQILQG